MRLQSLMLLAVTFASFSSALPTRIAKRKLVHDEKGNLKLIFSDQKIRLRAISIDEIVDRLATACHDEGQCDTSLTHIEGELAASGHDPTPSGETLTVVPSGSYPTWIHNGLIDALRDAVKAIAECEDVIHTTSCSNPMANCPGDPYTVNECMVPQYWGVNYQAPDSDDAAPPFIGADMTIKVDSDGFWTRVFPLLHLNSAYQSFSLNQAALIPTTGSERTQTFERPNSKSKGQRLLSSSSPR